MSQMLLFPQFFFYLILCDSVFTGQPLHNLFPSENRQLYPIRKKKLVFEWLAVQGCRTALHNVLTLLGKLDILKQFWTPNPDLLEKMYLEMATCNELIVMQQTTQ